MRFALMLAVSGCTVADRALVEIPVRVGGTGALPPGVTLTEATVTFSDLRLEEPPASTAWLERLSGVSAAYAHPGHDYPGDVAGELLGTFTVDLLAADASLGVAPCYEGTFATGRVAVAGTVAVLAGEHDGASFRFEVAAEQEIIGIPFAVTLDDAAPWSSIDLRFDPARALSFVDWGAPEEWNNEALFGVVATPTWSLEVVP